MAINRKQFLEWAGLGGGSFVIAVVASKMNLEPPHIVVAQPKYIPPTEGGQLALGLPLWTIEFETVTVDATGKLVQGNCQQQAKFFKEDLGNNVSLEMVEIPAGSFPMGSPAGEEARVLTESPQHHVTVPTFFMGMKPLTQEQYQQLMGQNPSRFQGPQHPVQGVDSNQAVEFCQQLTQLTTGRSYSLPSEAQWEYACRAGTTTPFYFGETITTDLVNYNGNWRYARAPKGVYRQTTTEVGIFPPNAFGLYDLHGNVWEWCADDWHDNYDGAPTDGSAWIGGTYRDRKVLRGGSWGVPPHLCRCASRDDDFRSELFYDSIGFRVVCVGQDDLALCPDGMAKASCGQ
ncbi:MAG: formylglycine-generating enzyme family protein [Symploca sp. SIO3C6]|nr:formylglycine-generating enzyme family protein [Symploca sp. SIO3C6]